MFSTTSIRSMVTAVAVFPVVSATVSLRMMTAHRNHIRKLSLRRKDLFFRLAADDALKLLHHLRVRIRSHSRTDDVKGILRRFCPGADRLVGRIL